MNFVSPAFLWALTAILIPVVIHLFSFRRHKKIYFSNVSFLKEVAEETASRNKVKHLLVLLMRMLAIAALVMAFAQPFIPTNQHIDVNEQSAISIYIDNSYSMDAIGSEVSLLAHAKDKAIEIAESQDESTQFHLLTNDFEGIHQRLVSRKAFIDFVQEIQPSPQTKLFHQIKDRQLQIDNHQQNTIFYLLSDFQTSNASYEQDSLYQPNIVRFTAAVNKNISIDTAYFLSPIQMVDQAQQLVVKVKNHGDKEVENLRIALTIDGQSSTIGTVTIDPKTAEFDTLVFTQNSPGWKKGTLKIEDYPIQFDDTYLLSFEVSEALNIQVIHNNTRNTYLNALRGEPSFNIVFSTVNTIDYESFDQYNLIIVDQLSTISNGLAEKLNDYALNGGSLLLMPNNTSALTDYNSLLKQSSGITLKEAKQQALNVVELEHQHGLFANVFDEIPRNMQLPAVKQYIPISSAQQSNASNLMLLANGDPFLIQNNIGNGSIYLSAVPADKSYSNWVQQPLFAIAIAQMAMEKQQSNSLSYVIGQDNVINTTATTNDITYHLATATSSFIPSQRNLGLKKQLLINDIPLNADHYHLTLPDGERMDKSPIFAFNSNRIESSTSFMDEEALLSMFGNVNILSANDNLGKAATQLSQGISLWRWFLMAALTFLLVEILAIRLKSQ